MKTAKRRRDNVAKRRIAAQSYEHNRSGFAFNADYYIHVDDRRPIAKAKGRSKFRRWTPEAILRAAAIAPTAPAPRNANVSMQKGSPLSFRRSRMVVANIVDAGQKRGLKRVV